MMCDSGFETAGAEGAADVHIVPGPDEKPAEFSNFHLPLVIADHDQSICTGPGQHLLIVFKTKW